MKQILELFLAGKPRHEIAKITGKSLNAVHGYLWRHHTRKITAPKKRDKKSEDAALPLVASSNVYQVQHGNSPLPSDIKLKGTCSFVIGEPKYKGFCDAKLYKGSYCEPHYNL